MPEAKRLLAISDISAERSFLDLPAGLSLSTLLDCADALEPLPGQGIPQLIRCGKPTCRCAHNSRHGPYLYRIWREAARVRKVYVKQEDAVMVRRQTHMYEQLQQELLRFTALRKAAIERPALQCAISESTRRKQFLAKDVRSRQKTLRVRQHHLRRVIQGAVPRSHALHQSARENVESVHRTLASAQLTIENAQAIIEASRRQRAERRA